MMIASSYHCSLNHWQLFFEFMGHSGRKNRTSMYRYKQLSIISNLEQKRFDFQLSIQLLLAVCIFYSYLWLLVRWDTILLPFQQQ